MLALNLRSAKWCFALIFACTLMLTTTSPVHAVVLLDEDFETYPADSSLAGQGGWIQSPTCIAPLMVSAGDGLGTQVADGRIRTGDGSYTTNSISIVFHALSSTLSADRVTTMSSDAYAFTSDHSHAANVLLSSVDQAFSIGWSSSYYSSPYGTAKWDFNVSGPGTIATFSGGFDEALVLEVIVDGPAGEVYGRLTHSGGSFETPHQAITPGQIATLALVSIQQDFRDSLYVGAEFDNILVKDDLFFEDFESCVPETGLAGQTGWTQSPTCIAPLIVSSGDGLSSQIADGRIRTGDGTYTTNSISIVAHELPNGLSTSALNTLRTDAYAFTSDHSHAANVVLTNAPQTFSTGWSSSYYGAPYGSAKWDFILSGVGTVDTFTGGFDEGLVLETVIDSRELEVYGRLIHSGGTFETVRQAITLEQIQDLTHVSIQQDYRDALYVGAEFDNISVTPNAPIFVDGFESGDNRSWNPGTD